MAKLIAAADGTFTPVADSGFIDNMIAGLQAPMLKDTEALDSDSAFWAAVIYGGLGSVAGGFVARRRTEAGKPAMAGVFY